MKLNTNCDYCGEPIFDGEDYLFDDYFEKVFCCDGCMKDNYFDEMDRMYERHCEMYAVQQDEI